MKGDYREGKNQVDKQTNRQTGRQAGMQGGRRLWLTTKA